MVEESSPMKRGLKSSRCQVSGARCQLKRVSPMKRGLKSRIDADVVGYGC